MEKERDFSNILARLRRERGISQKKAAQDLGVSQALLSHYEKGIRECGLQFVRKCSEYYGVTCDYLLGLSDSRNGMSPAQMKRFEETGSDITPETVKRALELLLAISDVNSSVQYQEQVYVYYVLAIYRAAITACRSGFLPQELFRLDLAVGKELANALINIQDVKFALQEDRTRSGTDFTTRNALSIIIGAAEELIQENFPVINSVEAAL